MAKCVNTVQLGAHGAEAQFALQNTEILGSVHTPEEKTTIATSACTAGRSHPSAHFEVLLAIFWASGLQPGAWTTTWAPQDLHIRRSSHCCPRT